MDMVFKILPSSSTSISAQTNSLVPCIINRRWRRQWCYPISTNTGFLLGLHFLAIAATEHKGLGGFQCSRRHAFHRQGGVAITTLGDLEFIVALAQISAEFDKVATAILWWEEKCQFFKAMENHNCIPNTRLPPSKSMAANIASKGGGGMEGRTKLARMTAEAATIKPATTPALTDPSGS